MTAISASVERTAAPARIRWELNSGNSIRNLHNIMVRLRAMEALTIADAAAQTGWSARMLRYLETVGLVVPARTAAGYRIYGTGELLQLRQLKLLREQFGIELDEVAFAARLRREPELRMALDEWMRSAGPGADWVEWEQRKHERLISAA